MRFSSVFSDVFLCVLCVDSFLRIDVPSLVFARRLPRIELRHCLNHGQDVRPGHSRANPTAHREDDALLARLLKKFPHRSFDLLRCAARCDLERRYIPHEANLPRRPPPNFVDIQLVAPIQDIEAHVDQSSTKGPTFASLWYTFTQALGKLSKTRCK